MHRTRKYAVGLAAGAVLGAALAAPGGAAALAPDAPAEVRVYAAPTPQHWDPLTDAKWAFANGQAVLTEPGTNPGAPRRPFEYAVVTAGPELTSVSISASPSRTSPSS